MSNTYILVDAANMFMRARHVVRGDDIYKDWYELSHYV